MSYHPHAYHHQHQSQLPPPIPSHGLPSMIMDQGGGMMSSQYHHLSHPGMQPHPGSSPIPHHRHSVGGPSPHQVSPPMTPHSYASGQHDVGSPTSADAKRSKTQRACDQCRRKKIRCDIIRDSEPQICVKCKKGGQECTFVLPITETRFKRKRQESQDKDGHHNHHHHPSQPSPPAHGNEPHVRFLGPTSIAFSIHDLRHRSLNASDPFTPPGAIEMHPPGRGVKGLVGRINGNLTVNSRLTEGRLEHDVLSRLITDYFTIVHDYFPVVCPAVFHNRPTPPFLLYSMAIATALASSAPPSVVNALRDRIEHCFETEDLVSRISLSTMQGLLLLSMHVELHGNSSITHGASAWLVRTSAAIRMASSLGWHRESVIAAKPETAESKGMQETKRRIWWACVIADRCIGAQSGPPLMIDLKDCDVELPSPYDVSGDNPNARKHDFFVELVKLSILLGRVLQQNFGINGLNDATDDQIVSLERDLLAWKDHVAPALTYDDAEDATIAVASATTPDVDYPSYHASEGGPSVQDQARILHAVHSATSLLFYRPLIRRTPAHLSFQPSPQTLVYCRRISTSAINAIHASPHLPNIFSFVSYCLMNCTLVAYRQWLRSKDDEITNVMRRVVAFFDRWEMRQRKKKRAEKILNQQEEAQRREAERDAAADGGEADGEGNETDDRKKSSRSSTSTSVTDGEFEEDEEEGEVYWVLRRHLGKIIRELIALGGGLDSSSKLITDSEMKETLTASERQILASQSRGRGMSGSSMEGIAITVGTSNGATVPSTPSSSKPTTRSQKGISDPLAINGNAALHSAALQMGDDLMGGGPGSKVGEMFDGTIGTVLDWQEWDSFFARVKGDNK